MAENQNEEIKPANIEVVEKLKETDIKRNPFKNLSSDQIKKALKYLEEFAEEQHPEWKKDGI